MLSVLMATHNGARTLPTVLDAYCTLAPPRGGWKLIIVDNGSTDTTEEVIGAFAQQLPLTYLFEPKRGKNTALNAGLSHIEGDLVVLTDDDAVPHPDWLVQMRIAADSQPSFSMFGGAILPRWELNPEPWILNWVPLDTTFALTDPAWQEGPVNPRRVFGPNSAYRADIFKSGYAFNPVVGPSGSNYAMGGECELNLRLMKTGLTAWYCKRAVVEHMVRGTQMDKDWILGRAFRSGRGFYRIEVRDTLKSPRLVFGIPRYILLEVVTQAISVAKAKLNGDERELFMQRWKLNFLVGTAYEARMIERIDRRNLL